MQILENYELGPVALEGQINILLKRPAPHYKKGAHSSHNVMVLKATVEKVDKLFKERLGPVRKWYFN